MAAKSRQDRHAAEGKETQYTVIKMRLHPTPEQAELIEKTFGCCRYLWNQMLADVQEFYAATDLHYIPTPARYKRTAPFLREVDSQALCSVHQNLRQAFLDFFRSPGNFGYPQRKTKKSGRDSFTVYSRPYHTGPSIRLRRDGIQMPKLGLLKITAHRRPLHWWSLRSVTISKARSGKYFAAITFGYEIKRPEKTVPAPDKTLGLMFSQDHFYEDSEGNCPELPQIKRSQEKLARMQRRLSNMKQGSNNYEKQLQKIRVLHEHAANQRKDFIHKESRRIANAWDAVCMTPQTLKGQQSGFGMFRECLQYKLERLGKPYILVDGASSAGDMKEKGFAQLCA